MNINKQYAWRLAGSYRDNNPLLHDCHDIPDPSALDPTQKNLLLLDVCFLGKQNKAEAYYTRGRDNNCDTIYIAQKYF